MRIGGTCRRESQLPLLLHLRLKRVPDSLHARVHAGPESVECESDFSRNRKRQRIGQTRIRVSAIQRAANQPDKYDPFSHQIGRASCRERVCQYVSISGVAVSLKKKKKKK